MPQVIIENPILNSPYKEPTRHYKFSDEGITNEVADAENTMRAFLADKFVDNIVKGHAPRAPTERFGKPTSNTIPSIIRGFKSATTARINRLRN
jgi:hypothetical protein